jgi:hypothetical protein
MQCGASVNTNNRGKTIFHFNKSSMRTQRELKAVSRAVAAESGVEPKYYKLVADRFIAELLEIEEDGEIDVADRHEAALYFTQRYVSRLQFGLAHGLNSRYAKVYAAWPPDEQPEVQ